MKNDFIINKKLIKYKYLNSYKICCATHCKMDIVLEELSMFSNFNILVVGVFECSFYSKKIIFDNKTKNYSYLLTDKEIVFSELSELDRALAYMNSLKNKTFVLSTCIPQINNLDIKSLIGKYDNLILLNVEDYTSCNSNDILSNFYLTLKPFLKNNNIIKNKISINDYNKNILNNLNKALEHKILIVNNRKYLTLLNSFDNHLIIDNTHIQQLSFYKDHCKELNIPLSKINKLDKKLIDFSKKYDSISIKSKYAVYLALLFYEYQIDIKQLVTSNYNKDIYNFLKKLNDGCLISFNFSSTLNKYSKTYNLIIDDEKISEYSNFDKICYIVNEVLLWD